MTTNKIYWSKMHLKNYDGTCADCGGWCTDEASKKEWTKCDDEIDRLRFVGGSRSDCTRLQYLFKRRDERCNYHWAD